MCSVGNTTPASRLRLFCCGLSRSTAVLVASCSAWPSTESTRFSIDEILRREFEALGVGAFPGRRAQIAGRYFAFAGVELGDLAEFQRIALAGIAVEIVEDAAAHAGDLRIAARLAEREVVDRPVRNKDDRSVWCGSLRGASCARTGARSARGKTSRGQRRRRAMPMLSSTTMNLSRSARFGDGPRLPFPPAADRHFLP